MAGEQRARRDWAGVMQEHVLGLQAWRAGHPTATFAEIEAELDRQWSGVRAQLLADLALAQGSAAGAGCPAAPCPDCGGTAFRDEGARERTVVTLGHAPVALRRDYRRCTQCGYRFFPSGR